MVDAVVEFDYDAQESDELTLKKGDKISNITIKPGGWWEGTLQRLGKRGMFPDNFVTLCGSNEKKSSESAQGPSNNNNNNNNNNKSLTGRKCKVQFNYSASVDDELNLNIGDIIDIISEVEEGWWKGKLKNRVGVFPSNFVVLVGESNDNPLPNDSLKKPKIIDETAKLIAEESKDAPVTMSKNKENISFESGQENLPALPPKPSKETCKVIYPYKAANEDELTLEEGDVITIITKDAADPGWWKGELKGKIGVFPDNFVKPLNLVSPLDEVKPDRPTKVTKGKDSITKSSSSASVYSSSSSIAVSRKFSDSIRPSVSVKPSLPPPTLKKPTLSPVEAKPLSRLSGGDVSEPMATKPSLVKQQEQEKQAARHSSFEIPTSANRGSIVNSLSSSNVSTKEAAGRSVWKVIESNDTSDGISMSRQSYTVTSSSSSNIISSSSTITSSSMVSSNSNNINSPENSENLDLDLVSRSAMLKHPTASRAKVPKRRLPTTLLSREDSRESDGGETMVNGNVEASPPVHEKQANSKQLPWVEELKLNQAKKSQGGGKTRVLIGSSESGISSSFSSSTTSLSNTTEISRVALRQIPITAQRPLSLQPGSAAHRLSGGDQQSPDATITLTLSQWNQLCDKVAKLESELEEQKRQRNEFSKAIKELRESVDHQAQKQKKMSSDVERLTDLVTQV